jgi:hypothetical protein
MTMCVYWTRGNRPFLFVDGMADVSIGSTISTLHDQVNKRLCLCVRESTFYMYCFLDYALLMMETLGAVRQNNLCYFNIVCLSTDIDQICTQFRN